MRFKWVSAHVEMTHVAEFKKKIILKFSQNRALYGRHVVDIGHGHCGGDLWMPVCVVT